MVSAIVTADASTGGVGGMPAVVDTARRRRSSSVTSIGRSSRPGLVDGLSTSPHQVVQAALTGGADVHARPFADRFESFEDLDRGGVVVDTVGPLGDKCVAHANLFCFSPRRVR
jgi:hypothetical protein